MKEEHVEVRDRERMEERRNISTLGNRLPLSGGQLALFLGGHILQYQ